MSDKDRYVTEVIRDFEKEVKKEFGLSAVSSGGSMPDKIHFISMRFRSYDRTTLEEARELEVKLIERFVKKINSHEKIRPYLKEYPADASVANISIGFYKPSGGRYTDGTIALMLHHNKVLFYNRADRFTEVLKEFKEEPYEEAVKIVRAGPPEGGWPAYTGDGTELEGPDSWIEQLAYLFGKDMEREFALNTSYNWIILNKKLDNVKFSFQLEKVPSFEEAGELTAILTKRLIERINGHERLREYLHEYPIDEKRISCIMAMPDFEKRQAAKQFMHIKQEAGIITCIRGAYSSDEDRCLHKEPFIEAAAREEKDSARATLLKFKR